MSTGDGSAVALFGTAAPPGAGCPHTPNVRADGGAVNCPQETDVRKPRREP